MNDRADAIIQDILVNHLPRIKDGLEKGYVDENEVLVVFDHLVRARILREGGVQGSPPEHATMTTRVEHEIKRRADAIVHDDHLARVEAELEADIAKEKAAKIKPPYMYADAVRDAKKAEGTCCPPGHPGVKGPPGIPATAPQPVRGYRENSGIIDEGNFRLATETKLINVPTPGIPCGVLKQVEVPVTLKEEIETMMAAIVARNTVEGNHLYVADISEDGYPRYTNEKSRALVQPVNLARELAKKWSIRYADMDFTAEIVRDFKREPAVPLLKPLPERVFTDRHVVPEKSEFKFILDKAPRTIKVPTVTGAFLKAMLPEAKRKYALYQEAEGNDPDIAIHDDSTVNVDGLNLYSVPPATFGAPKKLTCVCGGEIKEMPTSIEALLKCSACERVYMDESDVEYIKRSETMTGQKCNDATYWTTGTLSNGTTPVPMETQININSDKVTIKARNGRFTLSYEEVVRIVVNQFNKERGRTPFNGPDSDLPMFSCTYRHRVPFEQLTGERDGSLYKGKSVDCTPGMVINCMDTSNA